MTRIFEKPLYPYQRSADQDSSTPIRHPVVIVGAGPIGLAAAIDLAMKNVPVLVLDENDRVSTGSRAICYAKRTLEIFDRLGCGEALVEKGVTWNVGKVFAGGRKAYEFNLLAEEGHRRPAFINLQQYHLEECLVDRLNALTEAGAPIELRGGNRVSALETLADNVKITAETPEGPYQLEADWLIACDGANSPLRAMLGLDFTGRVFQDNFLIADIRMMADFPTERWFWFDPPFNRGQSALLHKQPDNIWRIDLQLGSDINKDEEKQPERVRTRLKAMLGKDTPFELEWISIYTFQCMRMERFRHGRVIFAGDAAHQVSPFGARGANSGVQDTDNLCWKFALVMNGTAPTGLLDSYEAERIPAADENIMNSSRSTDFITPKSEISHLFRDAVLSLSEHAAFARPLVNSGRLSLPSVYDLSPPPPDDTALPPRTRPGTPASDAPTTDGWLLDQLDGRFQILAIDAPQATALQAENIDLPLISLDTKSDDTRLIAQRYLGDAASAIYLIRPDQHIAARWTAFAPDAIKSALRQAIGYPQESPCPHLR